LSASRWRASWSGEDPGGKRDASGSSEANLDPLSYVGAIGLLIVIATVAALLPAKRAFGIDPMLALHYE
jgi:ABC-type antimicrobial peptide transport system permease subunit